MSQLAINVERILDLAGAVCDESASQHDFSELDAVLLADETSRRRYLKYCRIHATLEMEMQAHSALQRVRGRDDLDTAVLAPWESEVLTAAVPPVAPAPSSPVFGFLSTTLHATIGYFPEGMPLAYLIATVVTGLGILAASLVYVSQPEQVVRHPAPSVAVEPHVNYVGRITGVVDCKCAGTAVDSSRVPLGKKYELTAGLMEITYNTGAKVILQGPATYEVDVNGGYLSVGKLTGKLEKENDECRMMNDELRTRMSDIQHSSFITHHSSNPQSLIPNPFVIRTPTATVTDLGTEFGVEVDREGFAQVHVFNGAVSIADKDRQQEHIAHAGEAVQVNPDVIRRMEPKGTSKRFVRTMPPHPGPVLLADDFSGNALDRAKWLTKTWAPLEHASVVQRDGRVELKNRGYLVSRNQYNPDKLGGLEITGQWTFKTDGDILSILTRTDGVIAGPWGEAQNGLEFCVSAGGSSQGPEIRPRGSVAIGEMMQTGRATIKAGDTINFHIIDRGIDGLSCTLTNVKDAKSGTSVTSKLVADTQSGYYHVAFYNHQHVNRSDYVSYLHNVAIVAPVSLVTEGTFAPHANNAAALTPAPIVSDGSFEDAGASKTTYASDAPAASSIENRAWQTDGYVGIQVGNTPPFADNGKIPDGGRVAFVQSVLGRSGILSQKISGLQPGRQYLVSFWANARTGASAPTLQVFIDSTEEFSQMITPVEEWGCHTQTYHPESFTFTATSAAHTIKFQVGWSGGDDDRTAIIDKVSIRENR